MTAEEIFNAIRPKKETNRRQNYTLYEAIIFVLYKKGYHRRHIANAFDSAIYYTQTIAQSHKDIKDIGFLNAIQEIESHSLELEPYFIFDEKSNTYKVKTTLYIDNQKYLPL